MQVANKSKTVPIIGNEIKAVTLMLGMVKDYVNGSYKEIPLATIVSIVGALVYFVSPADIIPDTLPVIGQLDDIKVIRYALQVASADTEDYYKWKQNKINAR